MKKLSSILTTMSVVMLLALTTTSCARKVGCYFSQTHDLNLTRDLVTTDTNTEASQVLLSTACTE